MTIALNLEMTLFKWEGRVLMLVNQLIGANWQKNKQNFSHQNCEFWSTEFLDSLLVDDTQQAKCPTNSSDTMKWNDSNEMKSN